MLGYIDGRSLTTPVHVPRPEPIGSAGAAREVVAGIIHEVRMRGDVALVEFAARFDGAHLGADAIRVPEETIVGARSRVRPELVDALEVMTERVRATHERQTIDPWQEERPGERLGELVRPLRRVGAYVPGGRAAYPSSVIMAVVPARVAGVEGIAVASPPTPDGEVAEPVLAACAVAGVTEVYRIGGAQAIAALAYGTETVRPVEKIVGPGNVYVTLAKRAVAGWVGIDGDAGPTEIMIVADGDADPRITAADLIAQAEHGPGGSHVLVTWSEELIAAVNQALELEVLQHPASDDVENALIEGGAAVLVRDLDQALEVANAFAPEHLQLVFADAAGALERIRNAGAVFVGPGTPVPAGDYAAGTNHVLPSGGTARYSSGLSTRDFVKTIYHVELERDALARLVHHIDALAEAEGLPWHSRAVAMRLEDER